MSYKSDDKYIHAMQPEGSKPKLFLYGWSVCRPDKPISLNAIATTDIKDVTCTRCLIKLGVLNAKGNTSITR